MEHQSAKGAMDVQTQLYSAGIMAIRVPGWLLDALRGQPAGLKPWLEKMSSNFSLVVDYDGRTLKLCGPDRAILDLAVNTMVQWLGPVPDTEVTNVLESGKVMWKFHGDYVKVIHKFYQPELDMLMKFDSVKVREVPNETDTLYTELSCSTEQYGILRDNVAALLFDLDKLHRDAIAIPSERGKAFRRVRQFATQTRDDANVICVFNEKSRKLMLYGRDRIPVERVKQEFRTLFGFS